MAKQSILLIDPHQRSISVMEPSLRKYGYEVQCATSRAQAEQFIDLSPPDLIVMEVAIADRSAQDDSGVQLCKALKAKEATSSIPVIFVSDREATRAEALSAGAETFLAKPVYTGELKSVIEAALQRRQRVNLERNTNDRFFGRLEEMGLLDLLQIIDVSRRSGELMVEHRGQRGRLSFKEGELLDAEMGHLSGVDAIYRLLTWEFGQYEFDFNAPPTRKTITASIAEVKAEGLQRLDQWSSMCEQLPSLETVLRVDQGAIANRGEALSSEMSALMRLFDGRRTIQEVIDGAGLPDLSSLNALMEMYFEGLVNEVRERATPREDHAFVDASAAQPALESPTEAPTEHVAPPLPPVQTPATQFGFDGLDEFDMMGEAAPPAPPSDPLDDPMSLLDDAPPFGVDQHTPTPDVPPPPPSINEPPPLEGAPPLDLEIGQGDDEGRELLADLYASIAEPVEPPPVPDPGSIDMPSKADYDTLTFGDESAYDFGEPEEDFFSALNEPEEELEEEEAEALPANTKLSMFLIAIFVAAVVAFFMRDRVTPLKVTMTTSDQAMWYADRLSARLLAPVDDIDADWKIERELDGELSPALAGVLASAPEVKERSMKRSERRRFDDQLKEALKLYKAGGADNFRRAAQIADKALNLNPGNPHALMLSGTLHIEVGNSREAIKRLEQLMRINPEYSDTRINSRYEKGVLYVLLGSAYQELKKTNQAKKLYEQYIREYPEGNQARDVRNLLEYLR